jgi:hypothetical protein
MTERTPDQAAAQEELLGLMIRLERDAARYRYLRQLSDRRAYDKYQGAALDIAIDIDMDLIYES